jgi:hypothetical protein
VPCQRGADASSSVGEGPFVVIEQALYASHKDGGYQLLARSGGFVDEWQPLAERLCSGFGERPAGAACPACLFAHPFGKRHVAVVQVADQGLDGFGRPGGPAFRFLILARSDYAGLGGDPFLVADQFPAPWTSRGELPVLSWPPELPLSRTVEQVQSVLQRADEGPNLLGGAQLLVDGGRLVFERPAPDTELMRGLWTLLPTSTRCELWPASFAFGNALGFHALVVPYAGEGEYADYVRGEQAGDYPEGRYELNLQIAAEAGDQAELDALLARRSRKETWRLGLMVLGACLVLALGGNLLLPPPPRGVPASTSAKPDLPSADHFPPLSAAEQQRLSQALESLANAIGVQPLPRPATAEALLTAVADRLAASVPSRHPSADLTSGPVERRLRALLWRQGVAGYQNPKLSPVELIGRLRQQIVSAHRGSGAEH